MLITRILSALVFAPALFWFIFQGGFLMEVTCAVLTILMLWEFLRMTQADSSLLLRGAGYLLGFLVIAGIYGWLPTPYSLVVLPLGVILLSVLSLAQPQPIDDSVRKVGIVAFGVLYCSGLFPFLGRLRELENGLQLTVIALFCTWGGDTAAYFAGRLFGKRKLYPAISPKKTIEGALGGVFGGIAVAFVVKLIFGFESGAFHLLVLGSLAACMGIFGDLVASLVKRSTGTKDSSHLIPGHGGVLDRFDGVMFAAPAVYTYVILFLS